MSTSGTNEHLAKVEEFLRQHRKGIRVLLFTDMVDSTKLKQDLGDRRAMAITQQHHTIVRALLKEFPDAVEIDTAGDSFFTIFGSASDAVKFALKMQASVRGLAAEIQHPLADRIGIHAGEVILEDREGSRKPQDMSGIQVDTSSRVMALGQGNQILMTRFVFDNARQVLTREEIAAFGPLSWLNHGTYKMKGVGEPLEIFEVGETGHAVLARPPNSEKAQRHVSPDEEPVLGWRPALGQRVPHTKWVLEKKLGEGGFGEVWLGYREQLAQRRVLKFCFHAERVRALKREVAFFKLLQEKVGDHPNIVGIQDIFFDKPPYYIVMDYAKGEDLGKWADGLGGLANVPLEVRLEVVAQTADALQAAHDAGIIHRDVKPSNILVSGSNLASLRVKLTDFGIGQMAAQETRTGVPTPGFTLTMINGFQGGTIMYLAPEIQAGMAASTSSDIYALGVVLFQLVVADLSLPPTGDWRDEFLEPVLLEDLRKCLAGKPARRFASPRELAQRLRGFEDRRRQHISVLESTPSPDQIKEELARTEASRVKILNQANTIANKLIEEARAAAARVQETETQKAIAAAEQIISKAREASIAEHARRFAELDRSRTETNLTPPASATPAISQSFTWENSLEMKFAPVPGTEVLFSIWDTRVQDYQVFANDTQREWPNPDFEQGPTHPAVNVSWDDAQAFCVWLTAKERKEGRLTAKEAYRLPTDAEWSVAVGLAPELGATPKEKDMKIKDVYPWGPEWPPPRGAGNYNQSLNVDDFPYTSPVGSFKANQFGLFDMGGNVWQWCEDQWSPGNSARVLRGASWGLGHPGYLLSSGRNFYAPVVRLGFVGFRVVLAGRPVR